MAFRRRRVGARRFYRKKVGAIRRRRVVRKRRYRRRSQPGNCVIIARRTEQQMFGSNAIGRVVVKPQLADFDEANQLKDNFESYRILSVKLRVIPHFNVSSGGTDCPPYYIAPYKTDIDRDKLSTQTITSLDKCKTHNGWARALHSYVPAVLSDISYVGNGGTVLNSTSRVNWRPRMEINCNSDKIPHYCCIMLFSKQADNATPAPFQRCYTFQLEAKIAFYNQRRIIPSCMPDRAVYNSVH